MSQGCSASQGVASTIWWSTTSPMNARRPNTAQTIAYGARKVATARPGRLRACDAIRNDRTAGWLAGNIIATTITCHATAATDAAAHRGKPPSINAWWWRAAALPVACAMRTTSQAPAIRQTRTTDTRSAAMAPAEIDGDRQSIRELVSREPTVTSISDDVEAAAERTCARDPDVPPGEDVVERVAKIVTRDVRGDPRVVESPLVAEASLRGRGRRRGTCRSRHRPWRPAAHRRPGMGTSRRPRWPARPSEGSSRRDTGGDRSS